MRKHGFITIIFMFIILTGCTPNEAAKTETTKPEKDIEEKIIFTKEEAEVQSASVLQIIQNLASSGGAEEEQQKVTALIHKLDQYSYEKAHFSEYGQSLKNCLQALIDYSKGNPDQKALGRVYPDYIAAVDSLKQEEPTIKLKEPAQYDWFYAAAAAYEQGRKKDSEITLTFVGDNSFGTYPETPEHLKFNHVFKKNGGDNHYVFRNSLPWFNSDDFTVINAESAFTYATKAENKMWRIKSDPAHVAFLPASGVEAANLANNHTRDYFEVGYEDTLEAFAKNKVAVFNDGMPLITQIREIETVFLGYDCRMSQQSPDYLARIVEEIKHHKRPDNLVIVNMHWGVEYRKTPVYYQTQFGRSILDAGADIIMGGHPHRLESVEKYNGKYIIYSMGDYAFGADPTLLSRQTAMFRVRFAKEDGTVVMKGLTIVPTLENSDGSTTENNYQPLPVFGREAADIINELVTISSPIENGVIEYDYFDPFIPLLTGSKTPTSRF